ncbi:hypothetical protein ILUMI_16639 [Ignelater luminosus]|uniref:Uncharacterized protein n=1 Tax=Ignelater luminosus TaxID=2038154 RepID=A0A8K0CN75_IGNLU|nr:hypothetical protein ILUMI_16639 [Ignelater luminosus]
MQAACWHQLTLKVQWTLMRFMSVKDLFRIWPVNKYAFGDEEFEPAAVIAGTSNINTSLDVIPPLERTNVSKSVIEAPSSSKSSGKERSFTNFLQEFNLLISDSVASSADIVSSSNKAAAFDYFETQDSPVLRLDTVAVENSVKTDTARSETPKETHSDYGRGNSPKPGCSKIHSSLLVLSPMT